LLQKLKFQLDQGSFHTDSSYNSEKVTPDSSSLQRVNQEVEESISPSDYLEQNDKIRNNTGNHSSQHWRASE
jgi:hypothetical protein